MGVGVSSWRLAQATAKAGEKLGRPVLGVVSGAVLAVLMVNRLQDGDPGGYVRSALEAFPVPKIADQILDKYFHNPKRPLMSKYVLPPNPSDLVNGNPARKAEIASLIMAANFAEVWLAKQGHSGPIGINFLEKVQLPRPWELFGAMLAGVDFVLMGAGIPSQVPAVLDKLSRMEPASYKLDVTGSKEKYELSINPSEILPQSYAKQLKRPAFLPIVASHTLAKMLATKVQGVVNGFVIEGWTAGGHNAPPRGKTQYNENGEPIYGERDIVDLDEIKALGKPFWLAGSYASSERLQEAINLGATGIQVGSIFALCDESGIRPDLKKEMRKRAFREELGVVTDAVASPSGFPFQVAQLEETLSNPRVYEARRRICSIGYLVETYQGKKSALGFRCPAEPVEAYVQKGGKIEDTVGRKCICNGLAATVGLGEVTKLGEEPPIVTLGRSYGFIGDLIQDEDGSYTAEDALKFLLCRNSLRD
ncbi:MAG: 2-nitropropane dioxygenase [Dehalococcoidia bacterium]|nr:2-nitropropane dioxygenase [Dehalococcoidia bacterium]